MMQQTVSQRTTVHKTKRVVGKLSEERNKSAAEVILQHFLSEGGTKMKFRPCIDIHNGKVKQIVGGNLKDQGYLSRMQAGSEALRIWSDSKNWGETSWILPLEARWICLAVRSPMKCCLVCK